MIRRPPRSTQSRSSAASDVYKRQVLVLSASDRPVAVRMAIRAGARGYALKCEAADLIRQAIREVAAGRDWVSPRLAYIFATDDAPDMPALSHQETRSLQLYATGMALKSVAR